jgi:large subunit ribosomal protein L32
MAVPKKRTSRARRDKRRATHGASAPRLNECPRCHSPRLPHRVCKTCGTYAGREVIVHKVAEPSTAPTDSE